MLLKHELTLTSDLDQLPILEEFIMSICDELTIDEDIFPDIMLALTEATTNAIIHGNEFDPAKSVHILFELKPPILSVKIKDQGKGFDPTNLPSPVEDDNLLKSGGRGVYLMNHYAESVSYNSVGNEVTITFNILPS